MIKSKNISSAFRSTFSLLTFSTVIALLSGCAHQISSNVYSDHGVEEAAMAFRGVVVSVRQVRVENADKLENNTAGMLAGGVAGGVIGHQFGRGAGNSVATVAGALLGVAAGASAEQALSSQDAYEYVVELSNGEMRVVIQGMDTVLWPGQAVLLIASHYGRPRLIPDHSVIQYAR